MTKKATRKRSKAVVGAKLDSTVRAVDRAFDLLDCFRSGLPLRLSDLSSQTNLSKSTVHRLLKVLERRGAVARDSGTQTFSVGALLLGLAAALSGPTRLQHIARPILMALQRRTGETVALAVRLGDYRIFIDQVESSRQLRCSMKIGEAAALGRDINGMLLLAYIDPQEANRILHPASGDGNGITSEQLDRIREAGVAVSEEPSAGGVTTIAAPVLDAFRRPVAAISVCGPIERLKGEAQQRAVLAAVEAGRHLTRVIRSEAAGLIGAGPPGAAEQRNK